MKKLITAPPTPAMLDLLMAMRRGVVVHQMTGMEPYAFRNDTMRACSAQADGLINRGLAILEPGPRFSSETIVLTHAGKTYRLTPAGEVA